MGVSIFPLRRLRFPISLFFYATRRASHALTSLSLCLAPAGVEHKLESGALRCDDGQTQGLEGL